MQFFEFSLKGGEVNKPKILLIDVIIYLTIWLHKD